MCDSSKQKFNYPTIYNQNVSKKMYLKKEITKNISLNNSSSIRIGENKLKTIPSVSNKKIIFTKRAYINKLGKVSIEFGFKEKQYSFKYNFF